jgi:hypothetical protein
VLSKRLPCGLHRGKQRHSKLISNSLVWSHRTVQQSFFIVVGSIVRIEFLPNPDELAKRLFSDIFISHCWHSTMYGRKMALSCLHHGSKTSMFLMNIQISNSLHSYRLDRYDEFVEQEPQWQRAEDLGNVSSISALQGTCRVHFWSETKLQ